LLSVRHTASAGQEKCSKEENYRERLTLRQTGSAKHLLKLPTASLAVSRLASETAAPMTLLAGLFTRVNPEQDESLVPLSYPEAINHSSLLPRALAVN